MQEMQEQESAGSTSPGAHDATLGQKAAEQARSVADSGKARLAAGAAGVADALRHASDGLRSDEQEELARYTRSVADKIEQVADTLKNRDLASMVSEVTRFAKRQPALFLGGAFTAGLIAARFLKSSGNGNGSGSVGAASAGGPSSGGSSDVPGGASGMGEGRDDASLFDHVTAPSGFGPAPGGYGPASAPAGAHGGAGTFGAEGAGGGPGNFTATDPDDSRGGDR